ncbi:S8 family serine peptidase [Saccharomonospora sp. NPDC046836]|uniref:S8 family peptidase n=1 Tax=Saccharomonospora sp. NPDC046836 TaxID=3156921 RepID=UPI003404AD47
MRLPRHPLARGTAVLCATATFLAVVTPLSSATTAVSAAAAAPSAGASTVTLITGDTVTVGAPIEGTPTISFTPADGGSARTGYRTLRDGTDVYVVPDDVAHLVPQVLELDLFNVTELVETGYDDASTDALPLIVRGPRPLATLGAEAESRALPSIDATAVTMPKGRVATFTETLAAPAGPHTAGVTKVWLDRKVEATELDRNLGRIGAPQVWESGLSGAGVDVAVLDTGVDAEHPDLRGKIGAQADFTGEGTPADGNGHGTHVASIIGGTGAAADGARKGVAFDAKLLSGKVLGADGSGQLSWVIAGMEWAAQQGSDIVNLSLGGRASSNGDDPVAEALDALSAGTGTLFVVAAGNSGPSSGTIGTPGVAASALTVGAVGDRGSPAWFSSVGPTAGSFLSKPDIAAPGVDITAAKAGGGSTDPYTTVSGTSQATPHVAGAAALLRQQHPDWDWQRIKTTLMTTADPQFTDFPRPHAEGAGLLDLPGATSETLQLSRSTVDFGYLRYPDNTDPASLELTLTNTGKTAQAIQFADQAHDSQGRTAPEDLVTISRTEVTVAPGAAETVTITLTPANGPVGLYYGAVTLVRPGLETITLPLNTMIEPPRHDVRLTVLDRHGEPWAGGTVWLANMDHVHPETGGGFTTVQLDDNGQGTARILPGPVSMVARIETPAKHGDPASVSFAGSPEVLVDRDLSYTIDARRAQRLDPATVAGATTEVSTVSIHYAREDAHPDPGGIGDGIYATRQEIENGQVFLQPTSPVATGEAVFETHWRLEAGGAPRGRQADLYHLVLGGATVPNPPAYGVSKAQVRQLARIDADYRTITGAPDTYVETQEPYTPLVSSVFTITHELSAPQRRVELVTASPDVRWRQCLYGPYGEVAQLCTATESYSSGERTAPVWLRGPVPAVHGTSHNATQIELFVGQSDGEHKGVVLDSAAAGEDTMRLFRNGVELPRVNGGAYFETPPEPATFRLEYTSDPDPARLPIGTRTETSWTFPSQAPTDPDVWDTTPRLLTVDYQPGTDSLGRFRSGGALTMTAQVVSAAGVEDAYRPEPGRLRFWASTDHGKRWREAIVVPRGNGEYFVVVPGLVLRAGETVSVRAEATAAQGRAIEQTIIDAYPVVR